MQNHDINLHVTIEYSLFWLQHLVKINLFRFLPRLFIRLPFPSDNQIEFEIRFYYIFYLQLYCNEVLWIVWYDTNIYIYGNDSQQVFLYNYDLFSIIRHVELLWLTLVSLPKQFGKRCLNMTLISHFITYTLVQCYIIWSQDTCENS